MGTNSMGKSRRPFLTQADKNLQKKMAPPSGFPELRGWMMIVAELNAYNGGHLDT
jgi:hypothetical protein